MNSSLSGLKYLRLVICDSSRSRVNEQPSPLEREWTAAGVFQPGRDR